MNVDMVPRRHPDLETGSINEKVEEITEICLLMVSSMFPYN
jgi:hypothetical protein